jgi:tetratricopeptide (TPR) repeat protein
MIIIRHLLPIMFMLIFSACKEQAKHTTPTEEVKQEKQAQEAETDSDYQAISLLGDTLVSSAPSAELLARYEEKKAAFQKDPDNLENIIWYGRFTAYLGNYREAIAIYTKGLEHFPNESRLLRHRGHRYISIRQFDKAIADLEEATRLIDGKENMVEQDGMPNALRIPVSTMHGNIHYHLGLAYYLDNQLENALTAYRRCLESAPNPDNLVSATHWIYMILQRLGQKEEALASLEVIRPDLEVIENQAYLTACLFYKGEVKLQDIYRPEDEASPSNSALLYGIGNWYAYNGMNEEATRIFEKMVDQPDWASFGHIAAEADLARWKFNPGNGDRM